MLGVYDTNYSVSSSIITNNTDEVFEGVEKRIEIIFNNELPFVSSLRSMSKEDITDILDAAKCSVLVKTICKSFDAYILSESSLFIYDHKLIILTCGTTSLLLSIPVIIEKAHSLGLSYCACQFTRGDYLFPDKQYYPHNSFDEECNYLNTNLPKLENKFIYNNNRLHIFSKSKYIWQSYQDKDDIITFNKTVYFNITLSVDYINDIRTVLSKYVDSYDDYKFTPCGYSLNAYKDNGYITIHVTPQSNCSYVSIETYNIDGSINTELFKNKMYEIFHYKPPKTVSDDLNSYYKNNALFIKNKAALVKSY